MPSEEPIENRCGANLKQSDGYCERFPMENGRCYLHGGASPGAPKGNTNAMTHGLYAQRTNYYQALDDVDKAYVEAMVDSWIDNAPFGRENSAKVDRLFKIAIDQHKIWRANDELDGGNNIVLEQAATTQDGETVKQLDEHPVNLTADRLSRTTIKELKELGCLDSADDRTADAMESIATRLSRQEDND